MLLLVSCQALFMPWACLGPTGPAMCLCARATRGGRGITDPARGPADFLWMTTPGRALSSDPG